jgi:tetratricopeptide (TPR) repeat protein
MDRQQLQTQVNAMLARLPDANLYDILGVARNASDADVKKAFHAAARIFHVDQYAGTDLGALREPMLRIFGELSKAHATLTNADKRREYDASLALSERGVPTDVRAIFQADDAFRAGKRLLERGAYAEARRQIQSAIDLNRTEPDYWAHLHWAEFGCLETDASGFPVSAGDVKRLAEKLHAIARDHEHCWAAQLFLGHIARSTGDEAAAERHYKRVLALDAQNSEATSSLRLLHKRKEARNTGFFARIFGPKR